MRPCAMAGINNTLAAFVELNSTASQRHVLLYVRIPAVAETAAFQNPMLQTFVQQGIKCAAGRTTNRVRHG